MKSSHKKWVKTVCLVLPLSLSVGGMIRIIPTLATSQVVQAETVSPRDHATEVINYLANQYPNDTLPTYILSPEVAEYITAATTGIGEQDNYNIYYYAEDAPIAVNDGAVNELDPIASFNKSTYELEEEAVAAVDQVLDLQGEEVDLGYGITAYMQGAAGSSYLNWQEGNWSILVQASNIEGEDPVALAQEVVAYLEEVYLPEPSQVGQIRLSVSSAGSLEANFVVWQEGNVVYQVDHFDPLHAVIMAGSISQPTEQ